MIMSRTARRKVVSDKAIGSSSIRKLIVNW